MKVNVSSVIELIQLAVPHLEKTRGNVVCVSSLGSTMAAVQPQNYVISKAVLDHAVSCLAMQLGPKGVRINAVNPTFTPTRFVRELDANTQALVGVIQKLTETEQPLQGQACGPEEQAEVIVFLASDAARLVHGQCIAVDGGLSLKGQPINFPALFA